jgi:hypothetical protein
MNDRLLGAFRAFLVGWACLIVAHFVYVQTKTSWGAEDLAWDPTNFWHPIYFGVLNATLVIVPFALFQVPTARRYGGWSSAVGRAILALGIGTVLWGFGNFYWFAKNATGTEAPYPSLADAGYLAVLPFAAWSLWELSKVVGLTKRDWRWLPVALLFAFPLNAYIMLPQGIGAGTFDTPLSATISSTYILADVVLLGVAIIIAAGARRAAGGRFFAPVLGVVVSLSMLYIGDLFFNYRIANDIFYNAEISDLLYGGFIVLSSYAVYLFLVADVRANQAIQQADDEWEPSLAAIRTSDGPTLAPLDELATAILRGQERTMGAQTARSIAAGLSGVEIDADGIAHAVDAIAIDSMVREYRSIAGPLGEMTSWTAARGVLTRHPELDITSFARFRAGTATATGSSSARQPTVGV